ncbi:CgeB family protein [Domibacillus iocasae]|uniref:Spore protein YkvP/CgeB glycosyl transferase-like domain-containing protein n=1 Tax=Domibacillus iocasae TaxID=1714016 RepID=A0A1E7DSJ6_9BACI|nr:glycosyltransferase [Domibacillus iocasae]OES46057.1 hypothetical protein BA724_15830 [Domibacillus iocasae]
MIHEKLLIEKARNGNKTCRYNIDGQWKYLYSKYSPERINHLYEINQDTDIVVVLGLGLGYELAEIKKVTSKPIIIIEKDIFFFHELKNDTDLLNGVKVYCEDEYKQISLNKLNVQLVIHDHLIQCDVSFYNNVIKYFQGKKKMRVPVVCSFQHPTIVDDCLQAFQKLGYQTVKLPWTHKDNILKNIAKISPAYLFSVNYSEIVAEISETLKIPYISWTVDTPAYSLYYQRNLNYQYSSWFVYDESVVEDLKKKGMRNIHYMPVAANVERFQKIAISEIDRENYTSDVAFLGHSGASNEYAAIIEPRISKELKKCINELINTQCNDQSFVLKQLVNDEFMNKLEVESNLTIDRGEHPLLPRNEKLAFLLGRYHSYLERITLMSFLAGNFDLKIYGDEHWMNQKDVNLSSAYSGNAEHFIEMSKVFKCAKINLNITRSFVESGLPMRVFDVLGSEGFLVTNGKLDINRMFIDGKDLVVYRDLKDLKEIIRYYLEHEDLRNQIKHQGLETVKKKHTYEIRISKIMEIVRSSINRLN